MSVTTTILVGCGILILIVGIWTAVVYLLSPQVESPDGRGRKIGPCGDIMEISLKFREGRVVESGYWTNGCAQVLNCVCAAADLAKGKSPDEIKKIDMESIREAVGDLPRDRLECAKLSLETLYAALEDYRAAQKKA